MNSPEHNIDLSQAIVLYLKHYPGKNEEEFDSFFGPKVAPLARAKVRSILDQAMKVEVDWTGLTLIDGSNIVKAAMLNEHPELSLEAIASIGHYYTYLMR